MDCVAAATHIARFVASHFESYGLPMSDNNTPVMYEPLTPASLDKAAMLLCDRHCTRDR